MNTHPFSRRWWSVVWRQNSAPDKVRPIQMETDLGGSLTCPIFFKWMLR